jgi:hypothetical protein
MRLKDTIPFHTVDRMIELSVVLPKEVSFIAKNRLPGDRLPERDFLDLSTLE